MNNIYKDCAERLVSRGLSVVPVDNEKSPHMNGDDWQFLRGDDVFKGKYLKNWDKAQGLGLIMGEPSGITCLDIDTLVDKKPHLKPFLDELLSKLPPIKCGIKGNPDKVPARFFRYSGQGKYNFRHIDVDLLGDGSQKVLPPSKHPMGHSYEWVGEPLDHLDVDDLPDLPDGLQDYLETKNREFKTFAKAAPAGADLVSKPGRCKSGSHNDLSALGVRMFYQGFDFEDIVSCLIERDEIINQRESAFYFNCPSRKWRCKNKNVNAQLFVAEILDNHLLDRFNADDYFAQELADGFTYKEMSEDGKKVKKNHRQYLCLYNYIKNRMDISYCPKSKLFHVYNGKKYEPKFDVEITKIAQQYFKKPAATTGVRSEFLNLCRNKDHVFIDKFLLRDTGLINFSNGTYEIRTQTLREHRKSDRLAYVIDNPWSDDGNAPIWTELLNLISVDRPHINLVIEEFIGYILSGSSYAKFNKFVILDGDGENGKSTLLSVIEGLVGDDNFAAISLNSLNKERFSSYGLVNKLVNFCQEEPAESFSETGMIKRLTGGDSLMAEPKGLGAFPFRNLAKLIVSVNSLPYCPDSSHGMARRIIVVPCDRNLKTSPELKIKDVVSRILKNEAPQVLNRCVNAFLNVIDRNEFTVIPEGEARVEEMQQRGNPVKAFIADELIITDDYSKQILVRDLFSKFEAYTGQNKPGYRGKSFKINGFMKRVREEIKRVLPYAEDNLSSAVGRGDDHKSPQRMQPYLKFLY